MERPDFVDYYEVLQVSPRAEPDTITRLYRHLAKRYHPDNPETGDRRRFDLLCEAYETLSEPEKRAAYDRAYDGAVDDRIRLLDEALSIHSRDEDVAMRERLLALLYTQRRRNVREPALGDAQLERSLGVPLEHLAFHVWYVKEKGWIERTERGYAITMPGIDEVEAARARARERGAEPMQIAAGGGEPATPARQRAPTPRTEPGGSGGLSPPARRLPRFGASAASRCARVVVCRSGRAPPMRARSVWALAAACLGAACSEPASEPTPEATEAPASGPDAELSVAATPSGPEHGEWLLHGLSLGEQRYSPLDGIHAGNVDQIGLAFEFDDFVVRGRTHRGLEATALMDDGVLYFTGPWSVVYAVDARSGETRWIHDPQVDGDRGRVLCCDAVNRGVALRGDTLFVGTIDGYLVAIDKFSGERVWEADTLIDRGPSYSITGAPRLAGDLVVIGNGGAEMGVRGYVTAYHVETGEPAWRFFSVPSAGPDENDDVARARETWSEDMPWEYGGGGTAWDSMVYDPALGTLYVGVGNASPWPVWERGGGDNLYLSSIVALDAVTGRVRWHYQTTPGDSWDYTATQHMILADVEWQGAPRKLLLQAPKNGFFYVLDRESGELLSAEPYVPLTWASHVDMETGRPVLTENADYRAQARFIKPSAGGGHNWPAMAFNPQTGLVYIPAADGGNVFDPDHGEKGGYLDRTVNQLAGISFPDMSGESLGPDGLPPEMPHSLLIAWDPRSGAPAWKSDPQPVPVSGMLTTAGNLVIEGNGAGELRFYAADTGRLLRTIETGTAIMAPPITYELDGEQYIAVLAGHGGGMMIAYMPGIAPLRYQSRERLLVYKLGGGETPLPPAVEPPEMQPIASGLPTDAETLARGAAKYGRLCGNCHVPANVPSGYPDLWNMSPETHARFDAIVLGGAYSHAGMSSYGDVLGPDDTLAIRAFIAANRRELAAAGESMAADSLAAESEASESEAP